jgi:4-hydroxythreonine-4-phosphate dehydrogenase
VTATIDRRAVVLSQGDPQGIGPELILRIAALGHLRPGDLVVAHPPTFARLAEQLAVDWADKGLRVLEPLFDPTGDDNPVTALERAVDRVLSARPERALVTAPIDKHRCQQLGFGYPGHTEYLAARSGGVDVAMLMAGPRLRVALATIHVPLARVASSLTRESIVARGRLLIAALRDHYGIDRPRIGVLGLNPHAGERGSIGREEIETIAPAIAELTRQAKSGAEVAGPLSADSAFFEHAGGRYDALLAMYHDQGLAPFKLAHFHDGINMTLGLPFVRTSPDHGTAMDIAGRGIADPRSLINAVKMARGQPPIEA